MKIATVVFVALGLISGLFMLAAISIGIIADKILPGDSAV